MLINGDKNRFLMKFFQVLFNIWVTHYWLCFLRFYFLSFVTFSLTLANTFSFHGLKFEVVLSVIASIHVSSAVVFQLMH